MKTAILSVLTSTLMLALVSCDSREEAYRQGGADAVRQMQIHAEQSKQQLMQQIQPTLLTGVIFLLLVTFFGDTIVEGVREKLVATLSITPAKQAMLLTFGYLFICSALAIWSILRLGEAWAMPVMVLMAGSTAVFFSRYLPMLFKPENREARRLALSKIKLLLFAVAVILTIHELLAADGLIRFPG